MRLSRAPGVTVPITLLALSLLAAGCADQTEPTSGSAASETTSESEATDEPSETPTSATATTSATASGTPTSAAPSSKAPGGSGNSTESTDSTDTAALLLPPGEVGKLNREWRWTTGNDSDTEPERLVACHRAALGDLGAQQVAVREYTSDLDANTSAFHLVAAVPDAKTGKRLYAVLESWHSDCARRLEAQKRGDDGVKVSDLERLDTEAAAAATYVVIQPTATGAALIENVGIARDRDVVTVTVFKLEGEDFNYPRGRTPAAVTLRNAAALGAAR